MLKLQHSNWQFFLFISLIFASSNAKWCRDSEINNEKETPCFLESTARNPILLRASGNTLILPCHVAHSKTSSIEWWYQDFQKSIRIKIYPVFPAVRPTVLRFQTNLNSTLKPSNNTDVIDASVLLKRINVDDSGLYQCVIRPWSMNLTDAANTKLYEYSEDLPTMTYHVELTGARLCGSSLGPLPCFTNMLTSSPTVLDAYNTAFLPCIVDNHHRPIDIFWVIGNASRNSVLITEHLPINMYKGDRLRRIFPQSKHDFSVELTINQNVYERSFSCVVTGVNDIETTLFTYIVRSIDAQSVPEQKIIENKNNTALLEELEKQHQKLVENIVPHDVLTPQQIEDLRLKTSLSHDKAQNQTRTEETEGEQPEDEVESTAPTHEEETSTII